MSRLRPPPPRLAKVRAKVLDAPPAAPAWPSFTGDISGYVGTSDDGRVTVYVDPVLGADGLKNATDLVNDASRIVAMNDVFFGTSQGNTQVLVYAIGGMTDGTGGADHMGCDYDSGAAIEVCASFGNSMRVSGLFEAELSECCMGGNLCGYSTGEALSRWCAMLVSHNALGDFASAPSWYVDGMPNYVDQVDPTDGGADSTGCGMAFISWLVSQGYNLGQIAQGMVAQGEGGTLAALYNCLTGDDAGNAWQKFATAVNGLPFGVVNDDPFGTVA